MNEVIRQLYERKSVRVFTDKEISAEEKAYILESAVQAPTAGNQQMYTILDITDQELKDKLAVSCDNQPFIAQAKMVLVFCADYQKWYDAFEKAGCEPRKPGLGDIMENCEIHREMLNLPQYVMPAAMLVFGYPTEQQINRKKPERVAMKHVVHENGYRHMDAEELKEMFGPKAGFRGYEEWIEAFCKRKYNSDFSKEMSRSVGKYLEEFAE